MGNAFHSNYWWIFLTPLVTLPLISFDIYQKIFFLVKVFNYFDLQKQMRDEKMAMIFWKYLINFHDSPLFVWLLSSKLKYSLASTSLNQMIYWHRPNRLNYLNYHLTKIFLSKYHWFEAFILNYNRYIKVYVLQVSLQCLKFTMRFKCISHDINLAI